MFLPPGLERAWIGQYISLPAATLKAPVEGNRTIPVEITWLRDGVAPSFSVVFNAKEQRVTPLSQISAVHVSNIHSAVPVRLLFPDTGFEIELGANLEGYYPVVTNGLEFVAYTPLAPSGSDGVTIQVLNFLPPPLVFGLSPGGTVAGVSRIDTVAPLAGGPITSTGSVSLATPLAIIYGGTGATTADHALDALSETTGSQVGLLARDASGNWILQPLSAGGPPALPVSILNGGSGATTGFLALDNFSAAGSQTGTLQRNAGGAWSLTTAGTGTITGVTSGNGLSGGGSSGVVTVALAAPVTVANGGTGAATAPAALTSLGAAPLASPAFTGTPSLPTGTTAVTQAPGDNDTSLATTAFVAASFATNAAVTAADNLRVLKAGDTMTGTLFITPSGTSQIVLNKAVGANASQLIGQRAGLARWDITLGSSGAESTGNAGSDLTIGRYSDAGALIDNVLGISRATGTVTIPGVLNASVITSGGALALNAPTGVVFNNNTYPLPNNTLSNGDGTNAWAVVSAYNFFNPSDAELKTDITPAPPALDSVGRLGAKTFHWKEGLDTARTHYGFLAGDVKEVLGEDFGGYIINNGVAGLAYSELTTVLWRAVQELAAKVAVLEGTAPPLPQGEPPHPHSHHRGGRR